MFLKIILSFLWIVYFVAAEVEENSQLGLIPTPQNLPPLVNLPPNRNLAPLGVFTLAPSATPTTPTLFTAPFNLAPLRSLPPFSTFSPTPPIDMPSTVCAFLKDSFPNLYDYVRCPRPDKEICECFSKNPIPPSMLLINIVFSFHLFPHNIFFLAF